MKWNSALLSTFTAMLLMAFTAPNLQAQQLADPPAAPLPSQVVNAKRVFIANAYGDNDPRFAKYFGGPDGVYNQFYANVKSLGKYDLVSAPADADLVLEVTLGTLPAEHASPLYPRFRLAILDPRTNVLLWTISEPIEGAILTSTARKHVTATLAKLADDLKKLTAAP